MRSRYQPDGSVDYEADRMLEILRHADEELARQQREQAQQMAGHPMHADEPTRTPSSALSDNLTAAPTITDFINDPIADLLKASALTPPVPGLGSLQPNSTTSKL